MSRSALQKEQLKKQNHIVSMMPPPPPSQTPQMGVPPSMILPSSSAGSAGIYIYIFIHLTVSV